MTPETPGKQLRLWSDWDPARLERDRAEIESFAPNLEFFEPRSAGFPYGGYRGRLPLWPFDRPIPEGLTELLAEAIEVVLLFSSAHPMIPPVIIPIDPEPQMEEESLTRWHVLPGGALCLLQSEGLWIPEASVVDLLLKACGWHVEYALVRHGALEEMTVAGVVSDGSQDHLVAHALASREAQGA
jgi:hypothetical protein